MKNPGKANANANANANGSILSFFKPSQVLAAQSQKAQPQPQASQPLPTQDVTSDTQTAAGTQRQSSILKSGKTIVRSSDSEDSDGSDSSLEGLPTLGKKPTLAASAIMSPSKSKRSFRTFKLDASPIPVRTAERNDMAALVKQAKKHKLEEENRAKVLALMNDDGPHVEEGDQDLDRWALLEGLVADEEDEGTGRRVGRVLHALKRQEAGNTESRWFFFDAVKEDSKRPEFPQKALARCKWKSAFTNAATLCQTIITGFADHMVTMGEELPDEILLWMLDEVCFERRDSIRRGYCRIFTRHSTSTVSRLMDPEMIRKLFRNVGGTEQATTTSQGVGPVPKTIEDYDTRSWDPLISLVTLLGSVAQSLSAQGRNYTICLLARLCMDNIVLEKLALLQAIHHSVEALIVSIPESFWPSECITIAQTIFAFTSLATLQLRILTTFPDKNKPRLHHLRRILALSVFFNDPTILTLPLTKTLSLAPITAHLSTPSFRPTPTTDYTELSSRISILDIGVADALAPESSSPPIEETVFNSQIDDLISALENVSSRIRDVSAAHPTRNEAKNAIKVVLLRLGTARTKRKPRLSIWGDETREEDLRPDDVEMMKRFLVKGGAGLKVGG